ncbi:MAG: hypothetical protein Q9164_000567 [Protoblastenia rupestris]
MESHHSDPEADGRSSPPLIVQSWTKYNTYPYITRHLKQDDKETDTSQATSTSSIKAVEERDEFHGDPRANLDVLATIALLDHETTNYLSATEPFINQVPHPVLLPSTVTRPFQSEERRHYYSRLAAVNGVFSPSKLNQGQSPIKIIPRKGTDDTIRDKKCPICGSGFARLKHVETHFLACVRKNGNPEAKKWDDGMKRSRKKKEYFEIHHGRGLAGLKMAKSGGAEMDFVAPYEETTDAAVVTAAVTPVGCRIIDGAFWYRFDPDPWGPPELETKRKRKHEEIDGEEASGKL